MIRRSILSWASVYAGNDLIVGDNNNNILDGRGGINTVYGMGGNDTFYCMEGSNTIDGGSGTDTLAFTGGWGSTISSGGVYVYLADADLNADGQMDKAASWGDFSTYNVQISTATSYIYSGVTSIENLSGSGYGDTLVGDGNANTIRGNNGDDILSGNGGGDYLYGENNNDTLNVAAGQMAAAVILDGGSGTDTLLSRGWTFASGSFSDIKYVSLERVDVQNGEAGQIYSINGVDIRAINDVDNSGSTLHLYLDAGDTLNVTTTAGALSVVQTDDTYVIYTTLLNETVYATLNVHYGA